MPTLKDALDSRPVRLMIGGMITDQVRAAVADVEGEDVKRVVQDELRRERRSQREATRANMAVLEAARMGDRDALKTVKGRAPRVPLADAKPVEKVRDRYSGRVMESSAAAVPPAQRGFREQLAMRGLDPRKFGMAERAA